MKHLPRIVILPISHSQQKYDTCGDYKKIRDCSYNNILITVSELPDWRMEALIGAHELIEYLLVKHRNISLKKIDEFDIAFEKVREKGNTDEPGNDRHAPYHKEHLFATKIEHLLARELGVQWSKYEKIINNL